MPIAWPPTSDDVRRLLGRFIEGTGIEIGPGHNPYPLPPGTEVRYVDRWNPDENTELFPELENPDFPKPDVIANLDTDRLSAFADGTLDFVIASHVLEHMADPIGILGEIYRVLKPSGVAVVLLPDRRRTFDHTREPTPVEHLWQDYAARVATVVDEEHVVEFLSRTGVTVPDDEAARATTVDLHRRRSIHVHCWTDEEFVEVLLSVIERSEQQWELLDGITTEEGGPAGIEFGFVLRRDPLVLDGATRRDRFADSWRRVAGTKWPMTTPLDAGATLTAELEALRARLGDLERQRNERDGEVTRLQTLVSAYERRKVVRLANSLARLVRYRPGHG